MGVIISAEAVQTNEDEQWVADEDIELLSFFKNIEKQPTKQSLVGTDVEMVRVIEDLIDLLIEKQVFVFTELPNAVQEKLNARKQLRKEMNPLEMLIGASDDIF